MAKKRVSGDLNKSSEPRKAITIKRLSKPSSTKRRSRTKDLEDLSKRVSDKGDPDRKETLGNSGDLAGGGRKLKVMGSLHADFAN